MNTKYNSSGRLKTDKKPKLKKGDFVEYTDSQIKDRKKIKVKLVGVWDGKKVCFDDRQQTIVRNIWWLRKISFYERVKTLFVILKNINYICIEILKKQQV